MAATKTTLYLPDSLRSRLKVLAVRQGTTISQLLAEGADLVLARHQGAADRTKLLELAHEAERTLREGLYQGPTVARDSDGLVYGSARSARRSRRR